MAQNHLFTPTSVLLGAAVVGLVAGLSPTLITPNGRERVVDTTRNLAVAAGIKRTREPQVGDVWSGCDDARAAGTAPIYRGEPGYRAMMDGDDDGVACEPYRGG